MSLTVHQLTKKFANQIVVNSISFAAEDKGVIGFLGPNGAGKSTTMKMVTGYLEPDAGSIHVCGIEVKPDQTDTQKKIGYLPEGNPLYPEMYVREYLSFIAAARKIENSKDRIEEVIAMTGLQREANKKTGQLSKGYKQRVGLAAAILDDPEVLILDEPTSGLDPNQIIEIRELIRKLGETKTVLFSSHILSEVESICNRIIIINHGNIVADDQIDQLRLQRKTATVVYVKFAPVPTEGWYDSLSGIESVQKNNDIFQIATSDADALKKQILAYSLANNLNIVSLDSRSESLEDIFKNLTK